MFPHFLLVFFLGFNLSASRAGEREKRRKGRRESSFFLVSGLPLSLFHSTKNFVNTKRALSAR